jgi:hypothetical protein
VYDNNDDFKSIDTVFPIKELNIETFNKLKKV